MRDLDALQADGAQESPPRYHLSDGFMPDDELWTWFQKAGLGPYIDRLKAAERRATVERIRERIDRLDYRGPRVFDWDSIGAILDDEEAAR